MGWGEGATFRLTHEGVGRMASRCVPMEEGDFGTGCCVPTEPVVWGGLKWDNPSYLVAMDPLVAVSSSFSLNKQKHDVDSRTLTFKQNFLRYMKCFFRRTRGSC